MTGTQANKELKSNIRKKLTPDPGLLSPRLRVGDRRDLRVCFARIIFGRFQPVLTKLAFLDWRM